MSNELEKRRKKLVETINATNAENILLEEAIKKNSDILTEIETNKKLLEGAKEKTRKVEETITDKQDEIETKKTLLDGLNKRLLNTAETKKDRTFELEAIEAKIKKTKDEVEKEISKVEGEVEKIKNKAIEAIKEILKK